MHELLNRQKVVVVPEGARAPDGKLPITTEEVVRYGLRVTVLGLPAPPQLKTDQALQYVGPQAFGYDEEYRPLETNAESLVI
jgi:DUF917 family protein